MKNDKSTLIVLFFTIFSYGQVATRLNNETAEQFATRFKPLNSELTHKTIETKWNSRPVIITFYNQSYKLPKKNDPDQENYYRIIATIFLKSENNNYQKKQIGIIDNEGGYPKIESIFFCKCR